MKPKYAAFSALDPFFEVVQRGLSGLVEGEHYFDTIAQNATFEFRYDIAGWPKRVETRDALMVLYRGYGESIVLHGGDGLVVHRCDDGRVVVIEPEVHGRVVGSGAASEKVRGHCTGCIRRARYPFKGEGVHDRTSLDSTLRTAATMFG
jgi:hypothetical protein